MAGLVSRNDWDARSSLGWSAMPSGVRGVKIHYTGSYVDPKILTNHALCASAVRGIQKGHMNGNGWNDIGYSFVVCHHRSIFVGRGLGHLPSANGPGLNSGHYAVLGLVGSSGLVEPSPGLLQGLRDAIEYVRKEGRTGTEIRGHRDGYSTSCPGDRLYAWIKRGAPRPDEENEDTELVAKMVTLKKGTSSYDVKTLRALLFARGYVPSVPDAELGHWLENIQFNEELLMLVLRFQGEMKLATDGVVGEKTWSRLLRI